MPTTNMVGFNYIVCKFWVNVQFFEFFLIT